MSKWFRRSAAVVAVVAGAACSSSVSPGDLAGSWNATRMEFSDPAEPGTPPVDLIAQGAEFTMTFTENGTVQTALTENGVTENETGTYTLNGKNLVLKFGANSMAGVIEKNGDGLSLFFYAGVAFDFGLGDVPAELVLLLTRS